jgi:hypothetical protein
VTSIWFFIGISLAVNGLLILGAGIYQFVYPSAKPEVVLFHLHAGTWWGALLLVWGLVYCFKFAPSRTSL